MLTRNAARSAVSDASGAVADLGVLVPIVAALVLKNGLDPATVLVGAGALYVAAGAYFRVPVPVQPIKAAAAIAIARDLPPATIAAAGMALGAVLIVLAATGGARLLERVFARPIVRGLQLGVGLILVRTAYRLDGPSPARTTLVLAALVALGLLVTSRSSRRLPLALGFVGAGAVWTLLAGGATVTLRAEAWDPALMAGAFDPATLWTAITLLVIPQVPLTIGNAVVAVVDVERRYFGARAQRVTPTAISFSCGAANVAAGAFGGMPMCHGSGGLTAHYRAGARTRRMNYLIGGTLLALGLAFGPTALSLLALIPAAVLMGFLGFTGVMHAALVADQRGRDLLVAVAMGVAGFLTQNLAVALALGLTLHWGMRAVVRR